MLFAEQMGSWVLWGQKRHHSAVNANFFHSAIVRLSYVLTDTASWGAGKTGSEYSSWLIRLERMQIGLKMEAGDCPPLSVKTFLKGYFIWDSEGLESKQKKKRNVEEGSTEENIDVWGKNWLAEGSQIEYRGDLCVFETLHWEKKWSQNGSTSGAVSWYVTQLHPWHYFGATFKGGAVFV